MNIWKSDATLALAGRLGSCAVGPDFIRPAAPDGVGYGSIASQTVSSAYNLRSHIDIVRHKIASRVNAPGADGG